MRHHTRWAGGAAVALIVTLTVSTGPGSAEPGSTTTSTRVSTPPRATATGTATGGSGSRRCYGKLPTPVTYDAATTTVIGTPGNDVIRVDAGTKVAAGRGRDLICGSSRVHGGAGDDKIRFDYTGPAYNPDDPHAPTTVLDGDRGDDTFDITTQWRTGLSGGPGDDAINVKGPRLIYAYGDRGADTITALTTATTRTSAGGANVHGGPGNDVVITGVGDDHVYAGLGNDRLFGGRGDDKLIGDQGRDHGVGGRGYDSCVVEVSQGCEH